MTAQEVRWLKVMMGEPGARDLPHEVPNLLPDSLVR